MAYSSALPSSMIWIDDSNAHKFINPIVDGHQRMCSLMPRDYSKHPRGFASGIKTFKVWSKSDAIEEIKKREDQGTTNQAILDKLGVYCKDQDGLPLCWDYSGVHTLECQLAMQGDNDGKPFRPLSASCPGAVITGGRARGGYGEEIIQHLATSGTCYEDEWPEHDMSLSNLTPKVRQSCKANMITTWYELTAGDLNQLIAAVLNGFTVTIGLSWWGHQITIIGVVIRNGEFWFLFDNSWGRNWGSAGRGLLHPSKCQGDMHICYAAKPRSTAGNVPSYTQVS